MANTRVCSMLRKLMLLTRPWTFLSTRRLSPPTSLRNSVCNQKTFLEIFKYTASNAQVLLAVFFLNGMTRYVVRGQLLSSCALPLLWICSSIDRPMLFLAIIHNRGVFFTLIIIEYQLFTLSRHSISDFVNAPPKATIILTYSLIFNMFYVIAQKSNEARSKSCHNKLNLSDKK